MRYLLHHWIDHHAAARPAHPALVFGERTLDYAELAAASNRLARALVANDVAPQDRVGIYMDKGLEAAIALYGIMKAGAAYVPLDPAAPPERLATLIADCDIGCIVTAVNKRRALRTLRAAAAPLRLLVGIDDDTLGVSTLPWSQIDALPGDTPPARKTLGADLAYIMYTSGSTGTPKGIMHSHDSGLAFARWAAAEYGLRPGDRITNHAPLHFDLSTLDYFAGAVAGATTVIVPEEVTKLPASYAAFLEAHGITVFYTVPFALIQLHLRGALETRDLSALRWVIFGGEPFPPQHLHALRRRLPRARFDNIYGPAEVNGVTHYTLHDALPPEAPIPIGQIAATAEALVVDADDKPVAAGRTGELLVRSPTMMLGYWRRDELNARVFSRRTDAAGLTRTWFRTGDLVSADADGVFQFAGRKDRQIKVRGYRIELDEVELALAAHDAVEEAAAFAVADGEGSQCIHGQVTLRDGAAADVAALTKHLKGRLPFYAMPARIAIAQRFPRTTTGKIDRRRLAAEAVPDTAPARANGGT